MRGRIVIIVLAIAAVAVAFAASGEDSQERAPPRAAQQSKPPADALRLSFVYSLEKENLLKPLIKRFNAERHASDGRPVFVDAKPVASGEVETRIARGTLKPTIWSPASSFWGRLLNHETDRKLVPDENPSIVRTPLVIAMWKQLADAYGYPRRKLGYKDLGELATGGWAAVGKPQFGPFKYVHTNPDFSTSGLSAVSASYYAAAGKKEGLTEADVAKARDQVRRLERSIVHYGDTTSFVAQEMRKHGLGYASAVAMEEITLLELQPRRRRRRAARRDLSGGGDVLLRQPADHAPGRLGLGGAEASGGRVRRLPRRDDHAGGGGPRRLPPGRPGEGPRRAGGGGPGSRPGAARARPQRARAARAGQDQSRLAQRPQAGERDDGVRQLQPRWARRTRSSRRRKGSRRSSASPRRRTASG